MTKRHPNYRLAQVHRSYTFAEVAERFGVHRNTVRMWTRQGLETVDAYRPPLIRGQALQDFLKTKRLKNKRPCAPGQMYCLRCRMPQHPAGEMADFEPLHAPLGNLVGLCPVCELVMHRRVNLDKLALVRGNLDIRFPLALSHLNDRAEPSLNRAISTKGMNHE